MASPNGRRMELLEETNPKRENNVHKTWIKNNLLLVFTLFGVISGGILGLGLRPFNPTKTTITLLSYPGELFMRLLKLLILPLIASSLITGSASLNARLNGRIALRTLLYFLLTSLLNAILGAASAAILRPGHLATLPTQNSTFKQKQVRPLDTLLDLGRNIVSDNIFQATFQQTATVYVNTSREVYKNGFLLKETILEPTLTYRNGTNSLGVVVFCLAFGIVLGSLNTDGSRKLIAIFTTLFEVIMRMVNIAIWATPIGVASLIIGKILSVDNLGTVFTQLTMFIITITLGVFFYQLIILQLIYYIFIRKNPYRFYSTLAQGTLTAFATASTAAALPITIDIMENKVKIDRRITRFVLPIGCNINMDGTALFIAVSTVFLAQISNVSLGFDDYVIVVLAATAASFSSASVPSAALVLLLLVLQTVNLPDKDVFLLFAIDWLVDRIRTTNNMLGDCYAAAVVERLSRKELMDELDGEFEDFGEVNDKIEIV